MGVSWTERVYRFFAGIIQAGIMEASVVFNFWSMCYLVLSWISVLVQVSCTILALKAFFFVMCIDVGGQVWFLAKTLSAYSAGLWFWVVI